MILEDASTDIAAALEIQQNVEHERSRQMLAGRNLSALQMAVAARIAYGLDIAGKNALAYYAAVTGQERVHSTAAQRAATHIWNSGLVQKRNRGYVVSSKPIGRILREHFPDLDTGQ